MVSEVSQLGQIHSNIPVKAYFVVWSVHKQLELSYFISALKQSP